MLALRGSWRATQLPHAASPMPQGHTLVIDCGLVAGVPSHHSKHHKGEDGPAAS